MKTFQDKEPNFRHEEDGSLYLVRCYNCNKKYGRENFSMLVSTGQCAWCGWKEDTHGEKSTNNHDEASPSS